MIKIRTGGGLRKGIGPEVSCDQDARELGRREPIREKLGLVQGSGKKGKTLGKTKRRIGFSPDSSGRGVLGGLILRRLFPPLGAKWEGKKNCSESSGQWPGEKGTRPRKTKTRQFDGLSASPPSRGRFTNDRASPRERGRPKL